MNKLKKFIEKLDINNPPRHISIGGEVIAEYSSVDNSKGVGDKSETKNYGENKYTKTGSGAKGSQKKKDVTKIPIMVGDIVKNSTYGKGTVIRKTPRAKKMGQVTVRFGSITKDISAQSLILVKKRKGVGR